MTSSFELRPSLLGHLGFTGINVSVLQVHHHHVLVGDGLREAVVDAALQNLPLYAPASQPVKDAIF